MNDRKEIEQLLLDILGGSFELTTEKASKIIDILDAAPEADQIPLLAFVLRTSHLALESDFTDKGRRMTNERFQELSETILTDALKVFHVWIKHNPTEEYLAEKVWAYQKRFEKDDERDFFLTALLRDSHTPYTRIPDDIYFIDDLDESPAAAPAEDGSLANEREETALIMNLLNRGSSDETALAVALWNIMDRQSSLFDRFKIFRIILHMVKKDAEETTGAEMAGRIQEMFSRLVEEIKGHGVLGIAINAKDLPKEIRDVIEKMRKKE